MADPSTVDWTSASTVPMYSGDYAFLDTPGAGPSTVPVVPEARLNNDALGGEYQVDETYRASPYCHVQPRVYFPIPS